jgi:hypothetical protein
MTGLLGTGPRAMPLRAAPGEQLGAAACAADQAQRATGATDTRCLPYGAPTSSATYGPARTFAGKGPGNTGRPFGHL